jgi:hypothetical protein
MTPFKWGFCPSDEIEIGDILEHFTPEVICDLWCAALVSGEYEQCIGSLREFDSDGNVSYDALGLLCLTCCACEVDTMSDEEWERESPPARIAALAGLKCNTGEDGMAEGGEIEAIEHMNDRGDSFRFMAASLKDRMEGLDFRKMI